MNAIKFVFPEAAHLLCRRHISKDVQAFVNKVMGGRKYERSVRLRWNRIVNAKTAELYEQAVAEMAEAWRNQPRVMEYVRRVWLDPYHDRFVSTWTKNILHFGTNTANRVEIVHSRYKYWLGSSNSKFHRKFSKLHGLLEMHYDAIRSEFEKSLTKHPHTDRGIFRRLGGVVSHLAITKMIGERVDVDPNECDHTLRTCHGLPCACELHQKNINRRTVSPVNDINSFWSTLHVGEPYETRQQSVRDQFDDWARYHRESDPGEELRSYFEDEGSSTGNQYTCGGANQTQAER